MKRVLILCTNNSCLSQMAHGFLQSFDRSLVVRSAGTKTTEKLNNKAVEVMAQIGMDISQHTPKSVQEYLSQDWDYLITLSNETNETCPTFASKIKHRLHFAFDDPSQATGTTEWLEREFCRVRDEIKHRFYELYRDDLHEDASCPCGANNFCQCE
ncbi:MAG: arsenate reductase ArsC [Bacteroidales bacterium]